MTALLDALIYLQNISFDRHDRFKAGTDLEQQKERNKSGLNSFKTGFFRYASPFKTAKKIALDCLPSQQSRAIPHSWYLTSFLVPLFPCLVAPCCVRQIYASPIYKHRSAMDLPTKAAWPVRRYVVFRCRGFSPCLYTRERVLKSLESPLPPFTYRIAYFSQKNNRQDIRIPTFGFILIYKLFLFVLYVLTNRLLVWYNNSVVGNPAEQYRRTFLCKKYLIVFSSKNRASPSPKGY